jgi:phage gpG-like protein
LANVGISLEELQRRVDTVGKRSPEIVKRATVRGTDVLAKEMRRRYISAGLKKRSGDLYNSIKPLFNNKQGSRVKFAVGVGNVKGHSQVYKGATHEKGGIHSNPGGQPYFIGDNGRPVYVSRNSPVADRLPKTKPYTVNIPARPFVEPTRKAKLMAVRDMIAEELVKEFERGIT